MLNGFSSKSMHYIFLWNPIRFAVSRMAQILLNLWAPRFVKATWPQCRPNWPDWDATLSPFFLPDSERKFSHLHRSFCVCISCFQTRKNHVMNTLRNHGAEPWVSLFHWHWPSDCCRIFFDTPWREGCTRNKWFLSALSCKEDRCHKSLRVTSSWEISLVWAMQQCISCIWEICMIWLQVPRVQEVASSRPLRTFFFPLPMDAIIMPPPENW